MAKKQTTLDALNSFYNQSESEGVKGLFENMKKEPATEQEEQKKPKRKKAAQSAEAAPIGYVMKRESKSERTSFLLRPSVLAAIRSEAEKNNISVNELVNSILEKHIGEQTK